MSATDRRVVAESRQHFSPVIFMQEEGGSLSRLARACACLRSTISDRKNDFKTMPYNARARASRHMCDPRTRRNNQDH